jgi:hypothetical protein
MYASGTEELILRGTSSNILLLHSLFPFDMYISVDRSVTIRVIITARTVVTLSTAIVAIATRTIMQHFSATALLMTSMLSDGVSTIMLIMTLHNP